MTTGSHVIELGRGTAAELRVLQRLRAIKQDQAGRGHGRLIVDVVAGHEENIERAYKEKAPR